MISNKLSRHFIRVGLGGLIATCAFLFAGCAKKNSGGKEMVSKALSQQIAETRIDDVKTLETLTKTILENSYKDPREVARLAHSEDEKIKETASALLLDLGDLAVSPLLDSVVADVPEDYVWDLQTVVKLHLDSRGRIVKVLKQMLLDKEPVSVGPPFVYREKQPVPRRVCDEAYLLFRKLLAFEENEEDRRSNEEAFLEMEDKERDEEIRRFLTTKQWIALQETDEFE